MPRISTGTGDEGTTGLADGTRIRKSSLRVEAMGAVDEAASAIGLASSHLEEEEARILRGILSDLFVVGAELADPQGRRVQRRIGPGEVERIVQEADRVEGVLPPLSHFVLPGGSPRASYLFLARSLVRRAERAIWRLSEEERVNPNLLVYMNRLSDFLFLLARLQNRKNHSPEIEWKG